MRTALKLIAALLLAACVPHGGCATTDPLEVSRKTPPDHSTRYSPAREDIPPAPSPKPPSLIEEGPLSLAQCIYVALENSPELRSSWRDTRSAAAGLGQALSRYWPQFEFSANSQRSKAQVLTEVEAIYLRSIHDAQFSVTQLLLDGGQREAMLKSARASLRSANFLHNSTLLDVALDTETAYYQLLASQSLLEVAQKSLQRRKHHVELARKKYDAGMARKVEVSQALAEKADALLSVVEARSRIRRARGQLATTMGLKVSSEVHIADIPPQDREAKMKRVDALLDEASRHRPRLKGAAAEVRRIYHQLEAEKASRWPRVQASASYGWRDTHLLQEEQSEWALTLGINAPLFSGFDTTYRIMQARARLRKARADYEKLLRNIEQEVWKAYSEVLRTEEAITAAQVFVQSARDNVDTAEKAFDAGKATMVELIDAQTTYTRALNREVRARLEQRMAIARLERAVGRSWQQRVEDETSTASVQPAASGSSATDKTLDEMIRPQ